MGIFMRPPYAVKWGGGGGLDYHFKKSRYLELESMVNVCCTTTKQYSVGQSELTFMMIMQDFL